jgi:hypothetical protein
MDHGWFTTNRAPSAAATTSRPAKETGPAASGWPTSTKPASAPSASVTREMPVACSRNASPPATSGAAASVPWASGRRHFTTPSGPISANSFASVATSAPSPAANGPQLTAPPTSVGSPGARSGAEKRARFPAWLPTKMVSSTAAKRVTSGDGPTPMLAAASRCGVGSATRRSRNSVATPSLATSCESAPLPSVARGSQS